MTQTRRTDCGPDTQIQPTAINSPTQYMKQGSSCKDSSQQKVKIFPVSWGTWVHYRDHNSWSTLPQFQYYPLKYVYAGYVLFQYYPLNYVHAGYVLFQYYPLNYVYAGYVFSIILSTTCTPASVILVLSSQLRVRRLRVILVLSSQLRVRRLRVILVLSSQLRVRRLVLFQYYPLNYVYAGYVVTLLHILPAKRYMQSVLRLPTRIRNGNEVRQLCADRKHRSRYQFTEEVGPSCNTSHQHAVRLSSEIRTALTVFVVLHLEGW